MSHRQGFVRTAGLIGGISRSPASGVLSAHESILHAEDCEAMAHRRQPSLLNRLRLLQRAARGGERLCAG
jgi:hypothetical protein